VLNKGGSGVRSPFDTVTLDVNNVTR